MQVEGKTFEVIQSDVLQGSKVILDVEEEGLDERTILSLDAATKISSSGNTCFRSLALNGKEYCFVDAQPGECSLFTGPEGRRQLFFHEHNKLDKLLKVVSTAVAQATASAASRTNSPTTQEPTTSEHTTSEPSTSAPTAVPTASPTLSPTTLSPTATPTVSPRIPREVPVDSTSARPKKPVG
jgi:cell division septation protein DedD